MLVSLWLGVSRLSFIWALRSREGRGRPQIFPSPQVCTVCWRPRVHIQVQLAHQADFFPGVMLEKWSSFALKDLILLSMTACVIVIVKMAVLLLATRSSRTSSSLLRGECGGCRKSSSTRG